MASSGERARKWRQANPERTKAYDRERKGTAKYRELERTRNERRRDYFREWNRQQAKMRAWRRRGYGVGPTTALVGPVVRLVVSTRLARRLSKRPKARLFIGRSCEACGETWVSYAAMPDTELCSKCNKKRWQGNHRRRARKLGRHYEFVNLKDILERDGYRCQICGRKTRGIWPKSTSPTVDHIVPLARGGHHVATNLRCACLACNTRKGADAANDQLRLC